MLALARFALKRPLPVLALLALGGALAALGLFRLELRTDGAAIYPTNDPVVLRSQADRERFQEPEQVIVLVTSLRDGPAVQSPEGLRFLLSSHREIQRIPEVAMAGVRSLALRMARPKADLRLRPVLQSPVPDDPAAFAALVREIDRALLVRELFLSRDGRSAAIYVHLAPGADRQDLIQGLETWIVSRSRSPFRLRLTGPVVAEAELGNAVLRDLRRLVPVMLAAVALLLWLSLRTAGGVLIPLLEVLATLVCTFGLMGWTGVPVTLVTTILPVLLMALAITDEIHLLERIRQRSADGERLIEAAAGAYADLARPLYLSSLTTAAGFLSFGTASILPLRQFGIFAAAGLVLAMIFSFTLVPSLIALLPPGWIVRYQEGWKERASALPAWERLVARRARTAALAGLALLVLAVPGVFLLKVQDSWVDNFDPRSDLVTAERDFNRAFWGSYRLDVVFEGGPLFFQTPRGLALLEDFHRQARTAPHVGGILSPLPPLQLIGETTLGDHSHRGPLTTLPSGDSERAVAYLEAAQHWLDLRQVLTYEHDAARARLFVRNADFERGRELRGWLEARLPELTARYPVRAHLSGDVPVGLAVVGAIVRNQLRSVGGTLAQIALLLLLVLRSVRLTAAALAPVLAAALVLFAVLGYGGIPLGIATSMFAALTLGAGVDFSLHFVNAYRRERQEGVDHDAAVLATLRTGGRGLLWNALVLAFGFSVLAVSAIKPNAGLGLLLALAMLVSYATTLVFLPEILRRVERG